MTPGCGQPERIADISKIRVIDSFVVVGVAHVADFVDVVAERCVNDVCSTVGGDIGSANDSAPNTAGVYAHCAHLELAVSHSRL